MKVEDPLSVGRSMSPDELIKKNFYMNRFKVITNIILIIVLLGIAFYIIYNIESFKTLGGDVCAFCMKQTGATCMKLNP